LKYSTVTQRASVQTLEAGFYSALTALAETSWIDERYWQTQQTADPASRQPRVRLQGLCQRIMQGAPHLTSDQGKQLNDQARDNSECVQACADAGQNAPIEPHHLMLTVGLNDRDYEAAAQTIIHLVLKGCELDRR
jgi:hypothetical protein